MKIASCGCEDMLTIKWADNEVSEFDYFWLRDNAQDAQSFDAKNQQRLVFTAEIDPGIRAKSVTPSGDGSSISVKWFDESVSCFKASFLYRFRQPQSHSGGAFARG